MTPSPQDAVAVYVDGKRYDATVLRLSCEHIGLRWYLVTLDELPNAGTFVRSELDIWLR
jgi:hypothetical protein